MQSRLSEIVCTAFAGSQLLPSDVVWLLWQRRSACSQQRGAYAPALRPAYRALSAAPAVLPLAPCSCTRALPSQMCQLAAATSAQEDAWAGDAGSSGSTLRASSVVMCSR